MKRLLAAIVLVPSLVLADSFSGNWNIYGNVSIATGTQASGGGGSTPAAFGNTGYSASVTDYENAAQNRIVVGKFALASGGTVSKITALLQAVGSASNAKAIIYDDDGASAIPGTMKGTSDALSITTTKGSFQFTFSSPVTLTAGDWWIGIVSDGSMNFFYETETGTAWLSTDNNYASPTDNPTQLSTYSNEGMCVYTE